jgi:hypothetical protein
MSQLQHDNNSECSEDRSLLGAYLAERDIPCPTCGYNLRGLKQASCPECGDRISLTITNFPTRSTEYFTGLVGLSVTSLLAIFLGALELFAGAPGLSMVSLVMAVVYAVAAVRWRRNLADFSSLPRHKKKERSLSCWLGVLLFLLFIFVALVHGAALNT